MGKRLTGLNNTFAYMGVNPLETPNLFIDDRSPTQDDSVNFTIGALWLVNNSSLIQPLQLWMLVELVGTTATWVQLYPQGGAGGNDFITDAGTATQLAGVLNMLGGSNINTTGGIITGATNRVRNNLDTNVSVSGTVDVVPLINGVVQSDATGLLFVDPTLDGQVLISATGGQPLWANITSNDGTVGISNGPNTINLDIFTGPTQFDTDAGTAVPVAGILNYVGDGNTETTGATNVLSVDLAQDVSVTSWTAGNGIVVGNDLTSNGVTTFSDLGAGIVQKNGGPLFSDNGLDGQLLISATGGNPAWAFPTSTGATITYTFGPNSINLEAVGGGGGGAGRFAFLYFQLNSTPTVIGDGTQYFLGSADPLTIKFDNGGNVNPGDGMGGRTTFTCPMSGRYLLQFSCTISIPHPPAFTECNYTVAIATTARTYIRQRRVYNSGSVTLISALPIETLADLTIGDEVTYYVIANVLSANTGVVVGSGSAQDLRTWISGYMVKTL